MHSPGLLFTKLILVLLKIMADCVSKRTSGKEFFSSPYKWGIRMLWYLQFEDSSDGKGRLFYEDP